MSNKRKFRWGKWLFFVLLAAVLATMAGWYLKRPRETGPEYRFGAITRGELVQTVTATGQLNPVVNVQVGSQISGIIQKLHVDFNSPVKAGQVVAELDAATYQASVSQAEGNLANAKASRELARVNARRAEELHNSELISQSEYDKAMADLQQADAAVKISEASLERARVDLARCTIYAPIDGIVISRSVDVGQTVAASLSAPTLFIIANDLAKMQINANVSEADVGGVEVDQEVTFTVDAFPARQFTGKVVQVRNAPITVQNVVTYDTIIAVSNPDLKLKPGMTANVAIIIAQRDNVLRIPNSALRFRPLELPEPEQPRVLKWLAALTGKGKANAVSKSPPAPAAAAEPAGGSGRGPGGGAGKGPGGGAGRGPGGGRLRGADAQPVRTIYRLAAEATNENSATKTPQPLPIKTGISDGVNTEVTEGLQEGDQVIVGLAVPSEQQAGAPAGQNPFGGGGRRRF